MEKLFTIEEHGPKTARTSVLTANSHRLAATNSVSNDFHPCLATAVFLIAAYLVRWISAHFLLYTPLKKFYIP